MPRPRYVALSHRIGPVHADGPWCVYRMVWRRETKASYAHWHREPAVLARFWTEAEASAEVARRMRQDRAREAERARARRQARRPPPRPAETVGAEAHG
jgi:hypothetical protein